MKKYLPIICILGIATALSLPVSAQVAAGSTSAPSGSGASSTPTTGTTTPAGTTSSSGAPVATMSTIVVTAPTAAATPATTVLPNDTPVSSVFGDTMSVQDTPRSVTVLSPQLLQTYDVRSLQDLSKTSPSAYQTDQFGGYSVPNIRGQEAEVYINGQQRTTRSDGPPTSFNSVESAAIVPGPASSVYGPTGYTGGYVNFVTKQPYFDAWHSATSFTYGSYDTKRWTEDFGAPIIPGELAFRASYEGIDSGSYYNNVKTESQDGFVALAWHPTNEFKMDFNSELEVVRFNEITGWNRPNQDLIDNHSYIGGTLAPFNPIDSTGDTRLSDSSNNVSAKDSDYAKDINAQLTTTYDPGNGFSIVNRTYYEYEYLRNSEYAQYYANLITSNNVQDRLEFHLNFDTPMGDGGTAAKSDPKDVKDAKSLTAADTGLDFKHEIIAGFAFKYIGVQNYQGFFNEALNASDLSTGSFPLVNSGGDFNAVPIPGTDLFGSPGGNYIGAGNQPGTIAEQAFEYSAFYQHHIDFTPQWAFLYGMRADLISDSVHDPLPAAGFEPVSDNTTELLGSGNGSITYKPAKWITTYATVSYNQSYMGNTGGGYSTFTPNNNLSGASYHLDNYLYEGGAKLSLLDDKLFITGAGYYQTHAAVTSLGGVTQIRTLGGEMSETYQPDKHFFITMNQSYLDATIVDPTAQFTETPSDLLNPPGTPNFIKPPNGHYRESGLPQFVFNGLAAYKLDCGLGASLGYQVTDPIPTSEVSPAWIPWQYEIDASLFYEQKNWSARLNFFNITDQHNFSTGGFISGSGNDLITIGEPFHMEGTLSYKF